ncbi:hypothetical protein V6N13_115092 [Hibiscus sabdariffa]
MVWSGLGVVKSNDKFRGQMSEERGFYETLECFGSPSLSVTLKSYRFGRRYFPFEGNFRPSCTLSVMFRIFKEEKPFLISHDFKTMWRWSDFLCKGFDRKIHSSAQEFCQSVLQGSPLLS